MVFALTRLPTLDPARIYPVYAGSNSLSPFHYCYANPKTVLRLAAGRFFAHYNGEDIAATYWALRRAAVLYDVPERPVEISGPQAVPFLDRIFTDAERAESSTRGSASLYFAKRFAAKEAVHRAQELGLLNAHHRLDGVVGGDAVLRS